MVKPITLQLPNNPIAKARALLERAREEHPGLKQKHWAATLAKARKQLAESRKQTSLHEEAKQAARRALIAVARAYNAADQAGLSSPRAEHERRALLQAELKRLAGLTP
jgi:hypothetical protein